MSRTCELCKVENGNVLASMMVVRDYLTGRIAMMKNQRDNPYTMAELDGLEDALGTIRCEIRIVEENIKSQSHAEDEIPSGYSLARATDGKILLFVHFSEYHKEAPAIVVYAKKTYYRGEIEIGEPMRRWYHLNEDRDYV